MQPYDEDVPELFVPEDFLRANPLPYDARRLGFDHNTQEGAMIALASSLNPRKRFHRLVAWVLLIAFVGPILLGLVANLL